MKKILLVDLCYFKGHHETYFMKILSTLVNNNYFVYASCSDNKKLETNIEESKITNCQVVETRLSFPDKFLRKILLCLDKLIYTFGLKLNIQFSSLSNLIATRRLLAQIEEEIPVFFAHVDSIIPALPTQIASMFMPSKWIGLHVQPSYKAAIASGKEKSRKLFLAEKSFSLPSCKAILVLHPIYKTFFSIRFKNLKVHSLPEFISQNVNQEYNIAKEILQKSSGRKVVSIIGVFTKRRNLSLFLETSILLNKEDFFIVVLGSLKSSDYSEEELRLIRININNLSDNSYIDIDYYIPSDEDFNRLIDISDIIFLNYKDHPFSSNILPRAMMFRKPVIVGEKYLMEKVVVNYNWKAVTDNRADKVARKIQQLASNFEIDEDKFKILVNDFSENKFESTIVTAVQDLK